jgi:hypothetical protein
VKLRGILLVSFVALAATSSTSAAAYDGGRDYFSFRDDRINESSGVVASSKRDGVYFTHNDSGDAPRFFAVDDRGCTLATYTLGGIAAVSDVEDIARGPSGGTSSLWLGDIGDNNHMRNDLAVHRVVEPNVNASPHRESDGCPLPAEETVAVTTYRIAYPDTPHDAETLLADPVTGQLFIVTKSPNLQAFVYAAPLELDPDAVNVLELVGALRFPPSATYDRDPVEAVQGDVALLQQQLLPTTPFDAIGRLWAVGGDIHPDRARVVIKTQADAWEWELADGASLGETLTTGTPTQIPLRWERQGEAISYTRDGAALVTTCEDVGCTAHIYGAG